MDERLRGGVMREMRPESEQLTHTLGSPRKGLWGASDQCLDPGHQTEQRTSGGAPKSGGVVPQTGRLLVLEVGSRPLSHTTHNCGHQTPRA